MSKGTKQEYKRFNVDSIQNACLVMGMLISGVIVHLEKYKEYASEAKTLLENANSEYILAKNYDDINDKLLLIYQAHFFLQFLLQQPSEIEDYEKSSF